METAISSGECAPISRPMGHLVDSSIDLEIFSSNTAFLNADHLVFDPIQPILGLSWFFILDKIPIKIS